MSEDKPDIFNRAQMDRWLKEIESNHRVHRLPHDGGPIPGDPEWAIKELAEVVRELSLALERTALSKTRINLALTDALKRSSTEDPE
jgi:hypothetical protein